MSEQNKQVPRLRFPGFTDAWVKCELGDVVKKIKTYSLSRDVETDKYTGYKYIHYGDIHTNIAGYIDEESVLPNIKADDFELLNFGDLVVADASEDYQGIAKPAVLAIPPLSNVVAGLHTLALRPTHSDSIFLYYLLQTNHFKQFGKRAGTGMKVFGITYSNLSKFRTSFPIVEEQHKIGEFLHSIDNLITVNERELNKLKNLKKSYLEKMFPKNGSNIPELRFPGYTDAWVKCTFEDLGIITAGGDVNKKGLLLSGNYPVLANALNNDGIIGYYDDYKVSAPAVTITGRGNIGHAKARKISYTPTVRLISLEPFNSDVDFLENLINTNNFFVESTGVPQLTGPQFGHFEVILPKREEQTKIGKFFQHLDNLITVNERELKKLKELKKSYLNDMFV